MSTLNIRIISDFTSVIKITAVLNEWQLFFDAMG
jgi:hypothetical protein